MVGLVFVSRWGKRGEGDASSPGPAGGREEEDAQGEDGGEEGGEEEGGRGRKRVSRVSRIFKAGAGRGGNWQFMLGGFRQLLPKVTHWP